MDYKKVNLVEPVGRVDVNPLANGLNYKSPVIIKEFGNVVQTAFTSKGLFNVNTNRLQLYKKNELVRSINNDCTISCFHAFKDLVAIGDSRGTVKIYYDFKILKTLHANNIINSVLIYSAKDDGRLDLGEQATEGSQMLLMAGVGNDLLIWDVVSEQIIKELKDHKDVIKSIVCHDSLLITAGYDHIINVYNNFELILKLDHQSPIEKVVLNNNVLISVGNNIKFWDLTNNGKLIHKMAPHNKLISDVCLSSSKELLFSGSLDHLVKIIDMKEYKVLKTIKYPNAILSLDLSANDVELAVGMMAGLLCIRKKPVKEEEITQSKINKLKRNTFEYLTRGGLGPQTVCCFLSRTMLLLLISDLKHFSRTTSI
jgi:U3 small nucleolar RNA-associated protein 15